MKTKKTENLNAIETKVLAALISDNEARIAAGSIPAGTHQVKMTVEVTGTLTKGNDYEQPIVAKAEPWTLLAVALSHLNGVTIESITKEALAADPNMIAGIKLAAQTAIEAVKGPTNTKCNGKVTVNVVAVRI